MSSLEPRMSLHDASRGMATPGIYIPAGPPPPKWRPGACTRVLQEITTQSAEV